MPAKHWVVFTLIVSLLIILDMYKLLRGQESTLRKDIASCLIRVSVALTFGLWIGYDIGKEVMQTYYTGYIVEKTLAIDNIFLIATILDGMAIGAVGRRYALLWGIIGAILMRIVFIYCGVALIHKFEWLLSVLAVLLIATGLKMTFHKTEGDKTQKRIRFLEKYLPIVEGEDEKQIIVVKNKKVYFTRLFVAIVLIEITDLVFALDSIPAILAISSDAFIVITSNVMALLGLRALYFVLAGIIKKFKYLKSVLALLLVFIGGKTLAAEITGAHILSVGQSLTITLLIISSGILLSIYTEWKEKRSLTKPGNNSPQ